MFSRRGRRRLPALLLALVGAISGAVPASAAPGPAASAALLDQVDPSGFTVTGGPPGPVELSPGQAVAVAFTVVNTSAAPQHITVSVTGLYFKGDSPQFAGPPSPGLTATATPGVLTLAAQASQDVHVTLTAAASARPGGLYAGVVFTDVPPQKAGQVTVQAAQARPLIGHVPGPFTDTGHIDGFSGSRRAGGGLEFQVPFLDTGTIDYQVRGTVTITAGSATVGQVAIASSLVLPGNARTIDATYTGAVPAGPLDAHLHLVWGASGERSGQATTTVAPAAPSGPTASATPGSGTLAPTILTRPTPAGHHGAAVAAAAHGRPWWHWLLYLVDLLLVALIVAGLLLARQRRQGRGRRRVRQP